MTDRGRQRSRCRIFADILAALDGDERVKVTHVLHEANVPYDRLMTYLTQMEGSGLITRIDDSEMALTITRKGREYLVEFKKLEEFGSVFGVEV